MKKKAAHANLARWAIELMQYNLVLEHIDGKRNRVADALSRIAEDLTLEDIENVPESEDIAEFPRTLYMCMEDERGQVAEEEWRQESKNESLEVESVTARVTSSRAGVASGELESEVMVIDGPTKEVPVFEIVSQGNVMFSRQSLCDLQSESLELGKVYRLLQMPLDEEVYDRVSEVELWYLNNCRVEDGLMVIGPIQSYRIIAPEGVRRELFEYAHTSRLTGGHFALKKTHLRIKRFYWHGMLNDFKKWIQYCKECQERTGRPQDVPLMPSRISRVFEKLGADYCGPLQPTSRGNKYILNLVDWFSKFVISIPLPNVKTDLFVQHFVNEVVLKYGPPLALVTDNASNFTANMLREACECLQIQKIFVTA
ncbi:MAG TPA: DDE-type integrase/transposase/recombinase, partial [Puia sp.]|nr:DDE-type integrase/transposase/recombinase [Puia sp.]